MKTQLVIVYELWYSDEIIDYKYNWLEKIYFMFGNIIW